MKPLHWILLLLPSFGTILLHYFGPAHPYPKAWDQIPIFYAAFGFVGCIALILVAKSVGKAALLRKEDYYDRDA